jgi:hypothetical protein
MEHLKDKYVLIKRFSRTNEGKKQSKYYELVVGKCYFAGMNNFNQLQVTLDRCPIVLNHVNDILEVSDIPINYETIGDWKYKLKIL